MVGALPVCLALAIIISCIFSHIMDALYQKNGDILSFPAEISARKKYRRIIIAAFLFGALIIMGDAADFVSLLRAVIVVAFMAAVVCMDFEQQVIFDRLTFPFELLAVPFFACDAPSVGDKIWAAIAGGGLFLAFAVITKGGIGGGDIKLLAALGLWLGSDKLMFVAVTGMILAGIVAVGLIVFRRQKLREFMAYGPYFAVAAMWGSMY